MFVELLYYDGLQRFITNESKFFDVIYYAGLAKDE